MILFTPSYPLDILSMNPHASVIYVESHTQKGGGRQMAYLRNHLQGLPLTLRENFSTEGYLTPQTESRDVLLIQKELKNVAIQLQTFNIVCFPVTPFQSEFEILEKHSPKVAKLITSHIEQIKNMYI